MGRTQRRRCRRERTVVYLGSDPNFVRLTQWMTQRGWKQSSILCPAKFPQTGRGLMAKHAIQQGDTLVSIPRSLLLTTATAYNSAVGFFLSRKFSNVEKFLCQEVLASFLVWEKHLGSASVWFNYIQTLPLSFSTPYGLQKQHINRFPWFLQESISNASALVNDRFQHLRQFFDKNLCDHCQQSAVDIFTWDDFLWAWCCVNTRAVFIEPEFVPSHPLGLKDRNCLALAPYLDMFNHSDTAQVKVSFNSVNGCYEIVTLHAIPKFREVFINYGPHSNTKLFLEYGFILPSNLHDVISLSFSQIREGCKLAGFFNIKYEYEKVKFCKKHNLISQLYISGNGFSWNCLTLLKILLVPLGETKFWEHICFMGSEDAPVICDTSLSRVRKSIISILRTDVAKSQSLLVQESNRNFCAPLNPVNIYSSLDICAGLLRNFMSILDLADKETDTYE